MYQLSKRAERILSLAREAAREDGQGHVGTEHLLLAIVREGTGLGAKILLEVGATEEKVKDQIIQAAKDRMQETWVLGRLPGTRHFRDVLSKAAEAAKGRGTWQICSVHLLMALLAEHDSTGYRVLRDLGVSGDLVRRAIMQEAAAVPVA
jgi:ATP-dependent Clp protease ATP-binding subunit ClpC